MFVFSATGIFGRANYENNQLVINGKIPPIDGQKRQATIVTIPITPIPIINVYEPGSP